MAKPSNKKSGSLFSFNKRFSETALVVFAVVFGAIGSYTWLQTFAAPEDSGVIVRSYTSPSEQAWFSSLSGASIIILAAGPIAMLFLWWIWRRSAFEFWAKLLFTAAPFLAVMALT
ncbi:MAG TPA: hypothetical protein VFW52_03185 [Candidatus Saccharimonadales bacterium]|nr:hypothetical protein [Candidatus Saccharimonadales bacterium]